MFQAVKTKLDNVATLKLLCEGAESHALQDAQREPGAEHFLLAALDLPDGSARRAFEQANADPDALRAAVEQQYIDALGSIGLKAELPPAPLMSPNPGVYRVGSSGQQMMQALAATRKDHKPLLGVHVVAIVAGMPHGVATRALHAMGVDSVMLKSAADTIAESSRAH